MKNSTPSPNRLENGNGRAAEFEQELPTRCGRTPKGWKAMPYVLGNETFERLATIGLPANFMVYLLTQYLMTQVFATNVMNVWNGTTNFAPLIGAIISDAYTGRFAAIAFASIASFLGMMALTLTAAIPSLLPVPCTPLQLQQGQCMGPNNGQLGFLYAALALLTVGAAGIRPCSVPFGVDQFDSTTEDGKKGIASFFNWYYFSYTVVIMIALTVIVYIQSSVSWILGLGLPTGFMLCSIILFWIGTRVYVYVKPSGSVFTGVVQAFVAAYKKRKVDLGLGDLVDQVLYDPPMSGTIITKLPLTQQYRWLNKAAVVADGEVAPDGSRVNKWTLVSIQQVEEVKCIIRIIPIWVSGVICFMSISQQSTFTVSQALKMNRELGSFDVPAGSISVISMLALAVWVPIYEFIIVPNVKRITKKPDGFTVLQRIAIGIVFSCLSMVVSGIVEEKRRASAIAHAGPDGVAPFSVFWLTLPLILLGLTEGFSIIAQLEFYNKEFPENMRSLANSLLSCTMAGASYLSSLVVVIVHKTTRKNGHDWLDNDINQGRVDYFYYVIAGLGVLNFVYFLVVSSRYQYKGSAPNEDQNAADDIELSKA